MDPATAFQLACGAVQLIDFGIKTAKELHEISKSPSGMTRENERLESYITSLQRCNSSLSREWRVIGKSELALTPEQQQLKQVSVELERLSNDLLNKLANLKGRSSHRQLKVLSTYYRTLREKSGIEDISNRIQKQKQLLDTGMLIALCKEIDVKDTNQRQILERIDLKQLQCTDILSSMTHGFADLVARLKNQLIEESRETRALIESIESTRLQGQFVQDLLNSLHFETINTRQEDIVESYGSTFAWIFDPSENATKSWDSFVHWLEKENGVYWVNGKAGSGKSTLMNYIAQHTQLRPKLTQWAGSMTLIVVTFFFWRAGTKEQKSLTGLLRSMIFQIISAQPNLANLIFNEDLAKMRAWTTKRLLELFDALFRQLSSVKICLLIDGLDEFEGDEDTLRRLMKIVQEFTTKNHIKACISSRPEPMFVEAFARCKSLKLQDLNQRDIRKYVGSRLLEEPRMQKYHALDHREVEILFSMICERSDGVFLWASLAVQDVVRGLRGRDSCETLQRRINLMGRSLDDLFSELVSRIDPVYFTQAANSLQIVRLTPRPLSILHVAFASDTDAAGHLQRLIAHDGGDDDTALQKCSEEFESVITALTAHTAGLLNVNVKRCARATEELNLLESNCFVLEDSESKTLSSPLHRIISHFCFHTEVQFVHRSALEFLESNEHAQELMKHSTITSLTMNEVWLKCYHGTLGALFLLFRNAGTNHPVIASREEREIYEKSYSYQVAMSLVDSMTVLFDVLIALDSTSLQEDRLETVRMWLQQQVEKTVQDVSPPESLRTKIVYPRFPFELLEWMFLIPTSDVILCYALTYGIRPWISFNFDAMSQDALGYYFQALVAGNGLFTMEFRELPERRVQKFDLIDSLIDHGLQPNTEFQTFIGRPRDGKSRRSPWTRWVAYLSRMSSYGNDESRPPLEIACLERAIQTTATFIRAGADVNAVVNEMQGLRCTARISEPGFMFRLSQSLLDYLKHAYRNAPITRKLFDDLRERGATRFYFPWEIFYFEYDEAKQRIRREVGLDVDVLSDAHRKELDSLAHFFMDYTTNPSYKRGHMNILLDADAMNQEMERSSAAVHRIFNEYAHLAYEWV